MPIARAYAAADALADRIRTQGSSRSWRDSDLESHADVAWRAAFAAQLAKRLRDRDPTTTPALGWLEERLGRQGTSIEGVLAFTQQRLGAANVTMRNVVTSMRLISDIDWAELFERVSLVDERLRTESAFAAMDFATRDLYRGAIEELARGSSHTELEVADRVLAATRAAADGRTEPGRSPRRPRVRAHRRRAARVRARARRSTADADARPAGRRAARASGLRGRDRPRHGAAGGRAGRSARRRGGGRPGAGVDGVGDGAAAERGRDGADPSRGHAPARDEAAPWPRPERGGAQRLAHARGGADDPDQRGGARRAARAARGPPPGGGRWRPDLRVAVRRRRCRHRAGRGRRGAARRRGRCDRTAEPAPSAGSGGTAVPPAASAPRVRPRSGRLDGLGTQARQAARAQPPAPRRDRHDLPAAGRPPGLGAGGRPLRPDARCRHALAARCGAQAGRQAGASAQPAGARRDRSARGARVRRAAAAGDLAVPQARGGLRVPPRLRGAQRDRSLRVRGLGRVPGPVRGGVVHGEGHLRRRCLRGGARRTHPGRDDAEPRPLRGRLRARRPRLRRRGPRGLAIAVRHRGQAPAPVDARRLAAGAVAVREADGPGRGAGAGALEDARQPAPLAARARGAGGAGVGLVPRTDRQRRRRRLRPRRVGRAGLPAGVLRRRAAAERGVGAQPPRHAARGRPALDGPGAPGDRVLARYGLVDARRGDPDPGARLRDAPPPARVDDGGPAGERATPRVGGLLPNHGRGHARRARRGGGRPRPRADVRMARRPVRAGVGGRARARELDQPPAHVGASERPSRRRRLRAPPGRATHLALLRDLRDARRPPLAPGQLPGGPEPRRGAAHLADEHRPVPAVGGGGPRFRLGGHGADRRAARGDPGFGRGPRSLPRAPVQLVRDRGWPGARTRVRVVRRQREPRRPPRRGRQRLRGLGGRAARARGPDRRDRRGAPGPRGAGGRGRGPAVRALERLGRARVRVGGVRRAVGHARAAGRRRRPPGHGFAGVRPRRGGPGVLGARAATRPGRARGRRAVGRRRAARAERTPARRGRHRAVDGDGDGLLVPDGSGARAAVDRLLARRERARPKLLRPVGLGGAAREPLRDRQGRRGDPPLVPARAGRDARR